MPSEIEIKTIKGTRQKTANNTYGEFFPLGTDGQYIDMASGLDLEKELKLGGDHFVTVQEQGNQTKIIETYTKKNIEQRQYPYYQVETSIKQINNRTDITCQLYWIISPGNDGKILKKRKQISILENGEITEIEEEILT